MVFVCDSCSLSLLRVQATGTLYQECRLLLTHVRIIPVPYLFCLDIGFVISNEIVIICIKICTSVHKTVKLKVIRKNVTPKAVDKTLTGFWSKHNGVV